MPGSCKARPGARRQWSDPEQPLGRRSWDRRDRRTYLLGFMPGGRANQPFQTLKWERFGKNQPAQDFVEGCEDSGRGGDKQ